VPVVWFNGAFGVAGIARGPVIVPMTIVDRAVHEDTLGRLRRDGHVVHHARARV